MLVVKDVYYRFWSTEIARYLRGVHEPQEERVLFEVMRHAPAGAAMIELGAYWAYYSAWFGKVVPNARMFLVEPSPHAIAAGMRTFELNGLRGTFIPAGIGGLEFGDIQAREDRSFVDVLAISIDEIMARHTIDRVFIVHCDTQGSELAALRGAQRSMAEQRIGYFFISTHDDKTLHKQCIDLLTNSGFSIIAQHTMAESFSYDGLIVAKAALAPGPEAVVISLRGS